MKLGNLFEASGSISERLDWTIGAHDRLEAQFNTLLSVLREKGAMGEDEVVKVREAAPDVERKDD